MKTTYYEVKTANSTYVIRHDDRRTGGLEDFRPDRLPSVTDVWGRGRFFTLAAPGRPQVGRPMIGTDATGRIITSPVQSVRRIGFREFAAAKV